MMPIPSDQADGDGGSDREIVLCRDPEDLGRRAAIDFVRSAGEAIARHGRFSVALSGGASPWPLYRHLATGELKGKIAWERVHLFWGDERPVPSDHPDSNYRTASELWISHVPIPPENVHRIPGEKSDPEEAAREYERLLRGFFGPSDGKWALFDLILLGIGSDGHTASLFPGSPALNEEERWVVAVYVEKLKSVRLTLTLPVFNHARLVFFLAGGREKAPVIRDLFSGERPPTDLPARRIRPRGGAMKFFLDREAAGLIGEGALRLRRG